MHKATNLVGMAKLVSHKMLAPRMYKDKNGMHSQLFVTSGEIYLWIDIVATFVGSKYSKHFLFKNFDILDKGSQNRGSDFFLGSYGL